MADGETKAGGHWVIRKEISVGDIIAFVVAAGAVITAYFTLDKRLTVVEVAQIKQANLDVAQDTERQTLKQDLQAALNKMDAKLDWLIQRGDRR
jgi:hypothetical protein